MRANGDKQGQHKHEFTKGQRSNILVCSCGKFQHPPGTVGIAGIEKGQQATARPWKVVHFEMAHESEEVNGVAVVSEESGERVADNETYYPHAITEVNAALIVRAVNNHDALVEALETVLFEDGKYILPSTLERIKTALKAARGDA